MINYAHLNYKNSLRHYDPLEREAIEQARNFEIAQVARQLRAEAAAAGEVIPPPAKDFYLAGKAIFTVGLPTDFAAEHGMKKSYTFKVEQSKKTEKYPAAFFVSMLVGPDNTTDFQYLGKMDENSGRVSATAKSRISQDSMVMKLLNRVLLNIWTNTASKITDAGFVVEHCGRCSRCGRALTDLESIKYGMGAKCRGKDGGDF